MGTMIGRPTRCDMAAPFPSTIGGRPPAGGISGTVYATVLGQSPHVPRRRTVCIVGGHSEAASVTLTVAKGRFGGVAATALVRE
jgi:hypothetical protein